jgi:hypothetical protein
VQSGLYGLSQQEDGDDCAVVSPAAGRIDGREVSLNPGHRLAVGPTNRALTSPC